MRKTLQSLPTTPRRLAWLHFANDFTLDFLTPLLPSGVPVAWLGAMEGAADAVAQALKIVTGRRSDASGRRVGWVRAGYGLNAVMRPLAAVGLFLVLPALIVACRIGDRIGKGLRGSAADALVADWTAGDQRAVAYAAMRTMDHLGATLGALAAAAAMYLWADHVALAVAALVLPAGVMAWWAGGLRDAPDAKPKEGPPPSYWPRERRLRLPLLLIGLASVGAKVGPLMVLVVVTGLPLNGQGTAAWPLWQTCLAWAALGLVQAGAAAVAGAMTVRLGARAFLAAGWLVGAGVFAVLSLTHGWALIAAGIAYGVLSGFTEGAEKTWLSELAPKAERAVAFGALGLLVAAGTLAGNALVGVGLARVGPLVLTVPAGVLAVCALSLMAMRPARPL